MSRANINELIRRVLEHFNPFEFQQYVASRLPEGLLHNILSKMKKRKVKLIKRDIIMCLMSYLEKEDTGFLHKLHIRLCCVDVSLHHRKFVWYAYGLKDKTSSLSTDLKKVIPKLKQTYRLSNKDCDAHYETRDSIIWLVVIEKKINQRVVRSSPLFCAYFSNDPYLFVNRLCDRQALTEIACALSFKSAKYISLSGHDVKSLYKLLKIKEAEGKPEASPYIPQKPIENIFGVDYTKTESRRNFAEQNFSQYKDSKIETFSADFKGGKWEDQSLPQCVGMPFRFSLNISSANICETLQAFQEKNIIDPETCEEYITNFMKLGKNKLIFS